MFIMDVTEMEGRKAEERSEEKAGQPEESTAGEPELTAAELRSRRMLRRQRGITHAGSHSQLGRSCSESLPSTSPVETSLTTEDTDRTEVSMEMCEETDAKSTPTTPKRSRTCDGDDPKDTDDMVADESTKQPNKRIRTDSDDNDEWAWMDLFGNEDSTQPFQDLHPNKPQPQRQPRQSYHRPTFYHHQVSLSRQDSDNENAFYESPFFSMATTSSYAFPRFHVADILDVVKVWETDFQVGDRMCPKMASWEAQGRQPQRGRHPAEACELYERYKTLHRKWLECNRSQSQWWHKYRNLSLLEIAHGKGYVRRPKRRADESFTFSLATAAHASSSPEEGPGWRSFAPSSVSTHYELPLGACANYFACDENVFSSSTG